MDAQRLGAELRSHDASILDRIPTEVTKHCKAPTDGVSSSDMLGGWHPLLGRAQWPLGLAHKGSLEVLERCVQYGRSFVEG